VGIGTDYFKVNAIIYLNPITWLVFVTTE